MKPILIYQPGKVGSITIFNHLKDLGFQPNKSIVHIHMLDTDNSHKLPLINNLEKKPKRLNGKIPRLILQKRGWDIITLVREPVGRAISAWHAFHEGANNFEKEFDHEALRKWYDRQFVRHFGIDLFKFQFDKQRGWDIYSGGRARRVLVLRTENIDSSLGDALSDFLEKPIKVVPKRSNVGSYVRPIISKGFIDMMYSSEYAKHFYTNDELNLFKTKWLSSTA